MSTLAVDNIQPATPGSETYFLAKAWVNFNGTGVVAIRADGNVSSITDGGVGNYTVVFATAMTDASHSTVHAFTNEVNVQHGVGYLSTPLAGSQQISYYSAANIEMNRRSR
jgi:hypothetical protein